MGIFARLADLPWIPKLMLDGYQKITRVFQSNPLHALTL